MDIYTLVGTYSTEFEATLATNILNEGGIPTFVQSPDVYPPLDFKRGIKVMVQPDDAAKAIDLLAEFHRDLQEDLAESKLSGKPSM